MIVVSLIIHDIFFFYIFICFLIIRIKKLEVINPHPPYLLIFIELNNNF